MPQAVIERDPIAPEEGDDREFRDLYDLVRSVSPRAARLVGPNGESLRLPESLFRVLRSAVEVLSRGEAVAIVPVHKELTTQEAADILNVSRQYLVRLLDEGRIPYSKTGTHRRIRFGDLMQYKRQRDAERQRGLAELTKLSQELGLYD